MSKWTQKSKYHITNQHLTIAEIYLRDKVLYELWEGKDFIARGDLKEMQLLGKSLLLKV